MNSHVTRHAAVTRPSLHPKQKHTGYLLPHRLLNADAPIIQRSLHASQLLTVCIGPFDSPAHARTYVNHLLHAAAKEEQASASNSSHFSPGAGHAAVVKGNGSSIVPQQGDGNNGGSGQGGSGFGGGSGGGHPGNDSPGVSPDNQTKLLLLLLSTAVGAASIFGIYHLFKAIQGVTSRRRAAQPTVGTQPRFV